MSTQARIATLCQEGQFKRSVEGNREYVLSLVDTALREKPDLVCLPETFMTPGVAVQPADIAEAIPGPTLDLLARKAREGRCYVVCPLHTRQEGRIYNSAVILDRSGQVCGVYNKACPVTSSPDYTVLEDGVTPGGAIPTFDLDFGRIGVQICFDLGFPENWQQLAQAGVKAVLWPSAYDGGFPLRVFAYLHHYWVISSTRSGRSRIIDPCGEILQETSSSAPVIHRTINLDYVVGHLDFNLGVPDRIRQAYSGRVDVRQWDPGSAHFVVEPTDPTVTTAQLQEEMGFESTGQYHDRHREAYRRARAGQPPTPQKARHGRRPQYGK